MLPTDVNDQVRRFGHELGAALLFLPLFVALPIKSSAQVTFQRDHGYPWITEYGSAVLQDALGLCHFLTGPNVDTNALGLGSGALLKVNILGDSLWWRKYTLGDSTGVVLRSNMLAVNGDVVLVGQASHPGSTTNPADALVMRSDTAGNLIWVTIVEGSAGEYGMGIMASADGGFLCAGIKSPAWGTEQDFYAVHLNASGDTLWTRSYGSPDDPEACYAVGSLSAGNWVLVGKRQISMTTTYVHVVAINDLGDTLWTRTIDEPGVCYGQDVVTLPNDHILITGFSFPGLGCARPLLMELNTNGDVLWYQNYDHGSCEWAYSLCKASSGYALFGFDGDEVLWLTRVDDAGNELWSQSYAVGPLFNRGSDVQATSDGGFVMTGTTGFLGVGGADYQVLLIKTDSLGNVTTSTQDMILEQSVSATLFPNPAEDAATFRFTVSTYGRFALRLHDGTGKVVRTFAQESGLGPGTHEILVDLIGLSRGPYTLVLSNAERSVAVKAIKR